MALSAVCRLRIQIVRKLNKLSPHILVDAKARAAGTSTRSTAGPIPLRRLGDASAEQTRRHHLLIFPSLSLSSLNDDQNRPHRDQPTRSLSLTVMVIRCC